MSKFRLNKLSLDTSARIAGVRAYLDLIQQGIPEIENKERERLIQLSLAEGWDEADYDVSRQIIDERFTHWIPRFSAYSAIILLYSVLEVQLIACAQVVGTKHQTPFAVTDLRGRGLTPSILFIERLAGHKVFDQPEWTVMSDLQNLRNILVHRIGVRGELDRHHTQADHLAKKYAGKIEFSEDSSWMYGEAALSLDLCFEFVDGVERFFFSLFQALGLPTKGVETITE